jgi:hypothetical protein
VTRRGNSSIDSAKGGVCHPGSQVRIGEPSQGQMRH